MKTFRLALLGSVIAGIGVMAAVDASAASDVKKSVKMYGHVNRMTGIVDDGNSTEIDHLDNENSVSRFGIKATAKGANLTVQGRFEWEFACFVNRNVPFQNINADSNCGAAGRYSEVSFTTKYGSLYLGHGESASDNMIKADLSGTTLVLQSGRALSSGAEFTGKRTPDPDVNGGFGFANGTQLSGDRVQELMPEMDGDSRTNRILYRTPKFAGIGLEIDNATGGRMNYGITYGAKLGGVKIKSKIAASNNASTGTVGSGLAGNDNNLREQMYGGSISVLHNSGVSLTYSYAVNPAQTQYNSNVAGVNAMNNGALGRRATHYAKVGYQDSFTDLGKTYMGVDFERAYDGISDGDTASKIGVGVVQKLSAYGTEIYAAYEHIQAQRGDNVGDNVTGAGRSDNFKNINAGYFGARVKW